MELLALEQQGQREQMEQQQGCSSEAFWPWWGHLELVGLQELVWLGQRDQQQRFWELLWLREGQLELVELPSPMQQGQRGQ